MRRHRILKITVEDESRLVQLTSVRLTRGKLFLGCLALLCVSTALATALVTATPLRSFLPGYLKDSEREATETRLLRLDSLRDVAARNTAYLENMTRVLDTRRKAADTASREPSATVYRDTSLLMRSKDEERFAANMRQRERQNISVIAPLAAESMMFYPVSENGVTGAEYLSSRKPRVAIPASEPVMAVADGVVVAVYFSAAEKGWCVVTQHAKGFLSRYAHLGTPLVGQGDAVAGAQAIALPHKGSGFSGSYMTIEMWHNGMPLRPTDYITVRSAGHSE